MSATPGYIECKCDAGYGLDPCGADVQLVVTESFYPFKSETGEEWTRNVRSWQLACDEGHVLAMSSDDGTDDEWTDLPTVRRACWDFRAIHSRYTGGAS